MSARAAFAEAYSALREMHRFYYSASTEEEVEDCVREIFEIVHRWPYGEAAYQTILMNWGGA